MTPTPMSRCCPRVPLGAPFDYSITDNGNGSLTLTATYAGNTASGNAAVPPAFAGATVRFQAGAYQQAPSAGSTSGPDDGARVSFSAIYGGPGPGPRRRRRDRPATAPDRRRPPGSGPSQPVGEEVDMTCPVSPRASGWQWKFAPCARVNRTISFAPGSRS